MTVESLPERVSYVIYILDSPNCALDCYYVYPVLHDTSKEPHSSWSFISSNLNSGSSLVAKKTTMQCPTGWDPEQLKSSLLIQYGLTWCHDTYMSLTHNRLLTLSRPKSRDRLCRDAQYHDKYEVFKNACNATISINWPYDPSDTLIRISPTTEFTVNPVFITHIRTNSNWTLGPEFLDQ
jgi:hypothetical protein